MKPPHAGLTDRQLTALHVLVTDGTISAEQESAVRTTLAAAGGPDTAGPRVQVAEVVGYLGGGLMLAGATLVVGLSWDKLTDLGRVGIVAGVTVALIAAGLAIAKGIGGLRALASAESSTRSRIVSVLFALAALTGGLAAGTATQRSEELVGGLVGLGLAALAYAALPWIAQLLAAGVLGMIGTYGIVEAFGETAVRLGIAFVVLGAAWLAATATGIVRHRVVGFGIGAAITLIGAQQPIGWGGSEAWAYFGTGLAALAFVIWHLVAREPILLVAGVIGITIVVPEVVWDLTDGAVGGAAVVLIAGAVLLVTSGLGFLRRSRTTASHGR